MKADIWNNINCFKLHALLLIFAVACFVTSCAIQVAGGSAGETGNSYITGTIVDTSGNFEPGSYVYAIPAEYNHIKGDQGEFIVSDTTDENGKYTINVKRKGIYSIQALHPDKMTRLLITQITINTDSTTIDLFTDTLHVPGAARITLPDTVDTTYGYVYIPGSFHSERISEEQLITDNNKLHLVFDSLPAYTLPCIKYGRENSSMEPVSLADTVAIVAGDTININSNLLWTVYSSPDYPIPDNSVLALMVDETGNKWIGTKNSGYAIFDDVNWTIKNTGNSLLPHNTVSAFAQQKNGDVWIGTHGGLVKIESGVWQTFTTANSDLPNDTVTSIAIDSTGVIWFGTYGGCAEYDGSVWNVYNVANFSLPDDHVHAAIVNVINHKFFGNDSGLTSYDGSIWALQNVQNNGLPDNSIRNISLDSNNFVWIATPKGLSYKNSLGNWILYTSNNSGLPNDNFKCVAVDYNNITWGGTDAEANVVKIENNSIEIYNAQNSDALGAVGAINCIAVDIDNCIYFGTDNEGLVKLQIISRK